MKWDVPTSASEPLDGDHGPRATQAHSPGHLLGGEGIGDGDDVMRPARITPR
jgi:hypothetical protein